MYTEFEFTLPKGLLDNQGTLHRQGRMRLSKAADEMYAISNPLVKQNEHYLPILLLSRVVIQIGEFREITPQLIENLFAVDLFYLQELYLRQNSLEEIVLNTTCPYCNQEFGVKVLPLE